MATRKTTTAPTAAHFPPRLYVHREGEGDDQFYAADETPDSVEDGAYVAIYEVR